MFYCMAQYISTGTYTALLIYKYVLSMSTSWWWSYFSASGEPLTTFPVGSGIEERLIRNIVCRGWGGCRGRGVCRGSATPMLRVPIVCTSMVMVVIIYRVVFVWVGSSYGTVRAVRWPWPCRIQAFWLVEQWLCALWLVDVFDSVTPFRRFPTHRTTLYTAGKRINLH